MQPANPWKKKRSPLVFMLTGWLAAVAAVLLLGVGWPSVFPSGLKLAEFYGSNFGYPLVVLTAIIIATPVSLVGGLIGSRIPREGGQRDQYVAAALIAILMALPFSCLFLWYFTP
jgi:hypothetical protein